MPFLEDEDGHVIYRGNETTKRDDELPDVFRVKCKGVAIVGEIPSHASLHPATPPPPPAHLPAEAAARKGIPLYSGLVRYFPDAIIAVAELSRIGNDQHNPGKPLHWDRTKSQDELDALTRHLVDAGTVDTDNVRHSTKVAWRALANLQKEIERLQK